MAPTLWSNLPPVGDGGCLSAAPRKRTHTDSLPINGQHGFNPPGKSVKAKNHKRNGGRPHNTKRSL